MIEAAAGGSTMARDVPHPFRQRPPKPPCYARSGALAALWLLCSGCQHQAVSDAPAADLTGLAAGFHELFLHDECTGPYPPQPDTCLHERLHEQSFSFGGAAGTTYDVTLRIRGIFEPTSIEGGETPDPEHPYFKVGGEVKTRDWSYWHIDVSEPEATYYLNHYPDVSHVIHKQSFEATLPVAGGATVVIRVVDGNDRQIDNGAEGPDRMQVIEGVVDEPLAGQMLRLDVVRVEAR
jgi:hypothetical protein